MTNSLFESSEFCNRRYQNFPTKTILPSVFFLILIILFISFVKINTVSSTSGTITNVSHSLFYANTFVSANSVSSIHTASRLTVTINDTTSFRGSVVNIAKRPIKKNTIYYYKVTVLCHSFYAKNCRMGELGNVTIVTGKSTLLSTLAKLN